MYFYKQIYFDKHLRSQGGALQLGCILQRDNRSCLKMAAKCQKHGASCYIKKKKSHLKGLSERLTQAVLTITALCLCTGLGLPPDYLGSRALTELQPPPSTIGSSEFPFSIDGEYLTVC